MSVQKEAIVEPKNPMARIAGKDTINQIQNFKIRRFDNIFLVVEWLLEDLNYYQDLSIRYQYCVPITTTTHNPQLNNKFYLTLIIFVM